MQSILTDAQTKLAKNDNNLDLFPCSEQLSSYKCAKCPNFCSDILTRLLNHFESNHNYRIIRIKKLPYKCRKSKCNFTTFSKYILIRHRVLENKIENCPLCSYKSKRTNLLALHIFTNHVKLAQRRRIALNMKQVQCEYCSYKVRWKAELKWHILAKHTQLNEIKWIYCELCPSKFKLQRNLRQHVYNMHLKKATWFQCEYCAYKSKGKTQLRKHVLRKHTPEQEILSHDYNHCLFRSNEKRPLNRHIAIGHRLWVKKVKYNNTNPVKNENVTVFTCSKEIFLYECLQCPDFQTNFLTHLIHHSKSNHNDRTLKNPTHKCPRCDFTSHSRYLLIRHCLLENKTQECKLCNYKSRKTHLLTLHIFIKHLDLSIIKKYQNHNIRRIQCQFCTHKVRWKAELESHVVSKHTPLNEIQWIYCKHCSSTFKSKKGLRQHIQNKHEKNKKGEGVKEASLWHCGYCPYKGKRKDGLKVHVLRRHTAENEVPSHECDQCPFHTKERKRLSEHVRRKHGSNPKKYMCEYCGHRAMWNYQIRSHVAAKHLSDEEIEWFICEYCRYKCKTRKGLFMHVATKHRCRYKRKVK